MKTLKTFIVTLLLGCVTVGLVACGAGEMVTLGTYNATNKTFTALPTDADYSLVQNGYNLKLQGTIPYSDTILEIEAGNIVAIKFTAPTGVTVGGEGAYVKTTNRQTTEGWNEYGEEAFEDDGSLIWVTSVNKENSVQIKIKWNEATSEVVYTLTVDSNAVLETEA